MKEQWKKLDSDAKLFMNLEEGKPLPIKIELPITAFISDKENCCKKLITVLKVLVLLTLLILLLWTGLIFSVVDGNNVAYNIEQSLAENEKLIYADKLSSIKEDDSVINNNNNNDVTRDRFYLQDTSTENFSDLKKAEPINILKKSDDLKTWNPPNELDVTFIQTSRNNHHLNELQELYDKVKVIEKLSESWVEENQQVNQNLEEENKKDASSENIEIIDEIVNQVLHSTILVDENKENEKNQFDTVDQDLPAKTLEDDTIQTEPIDETIGIANFLMQLADLALNNQENNENKDFEETTKPETNFEEKTSSYNNEDSEKNVDFDKLYANNYEEENANTNEDDKSYERRQIINRSVPNVIYFHMGLRPSTIAAVAQYLEPIVGENSELLMWYENNKNLQADQIKPEDKIKYLAAKLLFSSNIMEFPLDDAKLFHQLFIQDFDNFHKKLTETYEDQEPKNLIQTFIKNRIESKLHMFKIIRKEPGMNDVLSEMIEANNQLQIADVMSKKSEATTTTTTTTEEPNLIIEDSEEEQNRRIDVLKTAQILANDWNLDVHQSVLREIADDVLKENDPEKRLNKLVATMKNLAFEAGVIPSREMRTYSSPSTTIVPVDQNTEKKEELVEDKNPMEDSSTTENMDSPVGQPEIVFGKIENQENKDVIQETKENTEKSEESVDEVEKHFERILETIKSDKVIDEYRKMNMYSMYDDSYDY